MEAEKYSSYGFLEVSPAVEEADDSETTAGAVEDNHSIGFKKDRRSGGEQTGQQHGYKPALTMANDRLTQTEIEQRQGADQDALTAALMGKTYEEKPIWATLWDNVRDAFFPKKLPPLELTSQPIPVADPMAVKRNPWAVGISTSLNVAILLLLLFAAGKKIVQQVITKPEITTDVSVSDFKAAKQLTRAGGGGGGGDHSPIPASQGHLPKIEKNPIVPPQVQTVEKPKLAMEPSIDVQKNIALPDNPNLPMIGLKSSANVHLASNGSGSGGGIGSGSGGGLGSGNGNGYGAGTGGNTGGSLYRLGGGDTKPALVYSIDPEFSDEARRAKYQGVCLISLIVDAQGHPQDPRVIRALGMGLDEKAIEAVRKYRFKPAMKGGHTPVPVRITIEVNFRLY
jgi:TonB family protein